MSGRTHDYPKNGRDPYAADHDEDLYFYLARSLPSKAFPRRDLDLHDDLPSVIPPGYTTLAVVRKLAVADRGRLLREWGTDGPGTCVLLLPGRERTLVLNHSAPSRYAVSAAVDLSGRVADVVLVGRVERSTNWH